ncbi:MAG: hypothetical protein D6731_21135, partial [Planctomycetota bacterium]
MEEAVRPRRPAAGQCSATVQAPARVGPTARAPRWGFLAVLLALSACGGTPTKPNADSPAPDDVVEGLNPYVLEVLRSYPTDGSYGYYWPKEGGWEGTTQDVV